MMNKIEALQYIIDNNGNCEAISCQFCPLNLQYEACGCMIRVNRYDLLAGMPINSACAYMAQQILNKIIEGTLLGTSNDKN